MSPMEEPSQQIYGLRLFVDRLRRQANEDPDPPDALWEELAAAEARLAAAERESAEVQDTDLERQVIISTEKSVHHLGAGTTNLVAEVRRRMDYVPLSIYHLLNPDDNPLITCYVQNRQEKGYKRVRVISFIEDYSAQAISTTELVKKNDWFEFHQLPTLLPSRVRDQNELTRGALNVKVEDLDAKVELHRTEPIWLLARTTLPLKYWDPYAKEMRDTSQYVGAFVTPNADEVQRLLLEATELNEHEQGRLRGYQLGEGEDKEEVVRSQVKALYDALANRGIRYVHSGASFGPEQKLVNHQRVRLPRESLRLRLANCFDGSVLFASLLESIGMSAAIVLVPGHAFVAWETWSWYDEEGGEYKYSNEWHYLETTKIGVEDFEQACGAAEVSYVRQKASANRLALRALRSQGIMPME